MGVFVGNAVLSLCYCMHVGNYLVSMLICWWITKLIKVPVIIFGMKHRYRSSIRVYNWKIMLCEIWNYIFCNRSHEAEFCMNVHTQHGRHSPEIHSRFTELQTLYSSLNGTDFFFFSHPCIIPGDLWQCKKGIKKYFLDRSLHQTMERE